jgi:hypothetical protein
VGRGRDALGKLAARIEIRELPEAAYLTSSAQARRRSLAGGLQEASL